ncbi:MAG: TonB-dependent receptor domain-containing protein [Gemmatimonadaceae bacterium]
MTVQVRRTGARAASGAAILFLLLAGGAQSAVAQATGTVRGRVTAQAGARPLANVTVSVTGTQRGAQTNQAGEYTITGVPAGPATLRAQLLGYAAETRTVTVAAGQEVAADFALDQVATSLDALVVTGQPGATRRREIGTSIATIDVSETVQEAPISTMAQLLQGRDAGITSLGASGTAGGGGTIVLRGMTSMTRDNAPLIYVDGIRLDTGNSTLVTTGGQSTSRMNDINPADIARVEVIKGAAATALYGTEASNGVIQIFTKKGEPGQTDYRVGVKVGGTRIPDAFPYMHPDHDLYPSANDLLSTGLYQEYTGSVRGGLEKVGYYLGGGYTGDEGSFINNSFRRANGRLNLTLKPTDNLTADVSSNFTWSKAQLPMNDNYIYGILTTLLLGNPVVKGSEADPYGGAFISVPYVTTVESTEETYRFTGGFTVQHTIGDRFNQRATIGLENVQGQGIQLWPYAPNDVRPQGSRAVNRRDNLQLNMDYSASLDLNLLGIPASTSIGGQLFSTNVHRVSASGQKFAVPGVTLVGATSEQINVGESEIKYTTAGAFIQEQLSFGDRLFLVGGVRVDGSSAFGESFGLQVFPKASVSYVISDESWFSMPGVTSLRLRAGYGRAGQQPGAFDATRTYSTFTANGGQPAIHTSNLGNPDLAPEVSTEYEGGFEAGLFGDRMQLSATAYHQQTTDALLNRTYAPSLGFLSTQLTNLGSMRNIGVELSLNGTVYQGDKLTVEANAAYAYNDNKVLDMGNTPFIEIDRFGTRVTEGYPVGGKWEYVTVGRDANGYPIRSDEPVYLGVSMPPHTGAFGTDITYGSFKVFANGQWAGGLVVNNMLKAYMPRGKTGERYFAAVIANNDDPVNPQSDAVKILQAESRIFGDFIERADWLKLREVGLVYTLPAGVSSLVGGQSARLSLSARNILTITGYSGTDPEISSTFDEGSLSIGADYFTVPQARQFLIGFDIGW